MSSERSRCTGTPAAEEKILQGIKPEFNNRNGSLDILIADTPILDYYRATDHGCKLQKIGDAINEDTYAVGMTKGFPLKDSISAVISKYSNNGYMDILQEKWYGALPCFKLATDMAQPRPLGVAAVAGVFILLGVGMALGLVILLVEHLFYRYTLPILRHKPKGTIWRSRNIMFFSQKLYRFINCVELVSPHHAARELVHTLRQGQITSLFQKSVKRKEHEQRRRRKSKAQFFEMIQEIRR
ncbi:glutamate receptor ionotropic, NMDA 3A-like [Schistocerca nitens]|uniref:glutamate receptor ionotropic, NMDA 3A-like n=1 Tax=Schistocerca nitens TaxID=7011 RepID=UPI0021191D61|nr:glutamate receptor ionotropic, NMDA 3A-like [Schistocerca nitens]